MKNGILKITPRARRLASESGVSMDELPAAGAGFAGGVCEKDVMKLIVERGAASPAPAASPRAGLATPLARRVAEVVNVELSDVAGSGARGKILKDDVLGFVDSSRSPAADAKASPAGRAEGGKTVLEVKPYSGVRKIIGTRLAASKFTAPHLYFTQKVDMLALLELREKVNASLGRKASVTDFIVKAVTACLVKFPDVNASLVGEEIELYESVNVGVAVAAPNGLIVPVLRDCEKKGLARIAEEASELVDRARNGKLRPDEYRDGTFTVSNLGMFGIENFTAIINPPESAILAVSATKDEVIAADDGNGGKTVAIRPMMNITLTVDHRIIDGLLAARFVTEVKRILENPIETLL
jgi:pyruvate dehydrogenase E2 component (dihydrolipoamide acetyltransferase)